MIKAITKVSNDISLLVHWVSHYLGLGVDEIVLNVYASNPDLWDEITALCYSHYWPVVMLRATDEEQQPQFLAGDWSKEFARRRTARPNDWIIPADLDEFIRFPLSLKKHIGELRFNGENYIRGRHIDRFSGDGTLTQALPLPSLWEQYPLEGLTAQRMHPKKRLCYKVTLCRGSNEIGIGHHWVKDHRPFREDCSIYYFGWRAGLIETLDRRRNLYRETKHPAWEHEMDLALRYLGAYARMVPKDFSAQPGWKPLYSSHQQKQRRQTRYFGINQGPHDGGSACFDESGNLLLYSQTERLSRKKNDAAIGDFTKLLKRNGLRDVDDGSLFFCTWPDRYNSFIKNQRLPAEIFKRDSNLPFFDQKRQVHLLSHHLCHVAASWMFRKQDVPDENLYIALDGLGIRSDGKSGCFSMGVISPTRFEEWSFDADERIYSPYLRLSGLYLPNTAQLHVAGKLMGLAGYVPQDTLKRLQWDYPLKVLNERTKRDGMTREIITELASLYNSYILDVSIFIRNILKRFPEYRRVVVGGGAFLALELNTLIAEEGREVVFGPPINDSGIALGSAAYGYFLANGRWPNKLHNPFLQWQPHEARKQYISPTSAAALLIQGSIIGTVIGRGEAGPRALGNRSLLALPTKENAKKISVDIKGREYYRPVAPIVTDRCFPHLFEGPRGEYMQFRNRCTDHAKSITPGIVHNDGTARVQVLTPNINPWLYEVLVEVGKSYGTECLINTSLNGRGSPICNSLQDASELSHHNIQLVSF